MAQQMPLRAEAVRLSVEADPLDCRLLLLPVALLEFKFRGVDVLVLAVDRSPWT